MAEHTPFDLVHKLDVEKVLKTDKGPDALLKSFKVEDFTTKGDNYACIVACVVVQYEKSGKACDISYVVKLNPGHKGFLNNMMGPMFNSEIEFYSTILPKLNKELIASGETCLRVPDYFHSVAENGHEVIYLEDLRRAGYKMHDRTVCMDKAHTQLILKELARLHAASVLFFSREGITKANIFQKYPVLAGNFNEFKDMMEETGFNFIKNSLENSAQLVESVPNYEYVVKFLKSKANMDFDEYELLMESSDNFLVIRHGDCWNNNFLFK